MSPQARRLAGRRAFVTGGGSGIGRAAVLGGLDSIFANAGTAGAGWIHETALADWEAVLRVNLTGVFLTAKHTLPHLMEAGGGVKTDLGRNSAEDRASHSTPTPEGGR